MDPIKRERDIDLVFDGVDLRAYTETIDGKEVKVLSGTASSTAQDLYGSIIRASAQAKMLDKLQGLAAQLSGKNSGLTAWLNHSYKIPEDTLGAFVTASLAVRNEGGQEFIDLDIKCRLVDETSNPRALAAWKQVKDGIRHGWSIGAYFTDIEWMSDDPESPDFWNFFVNDIDLLEISLVGIPANQRAWCRSGEDIRAKVVETAEAIAREARENPKAVAQRFGVREGRLEKADVKSRFIRSLVQRSLTGETADSESTSPIVPQNLEAPTTQHTYSGMTRLLDAEVVPDAREGEWTVTVKLDADTTELEAKLRELQAKAGDLAAQLGVGPDVEPTELASEVRGLAGRDDVATNEALGDNDRQLLERAAVAIDTLSLAAKAQSDLKTLEGVDTQKISDAIGHCADAVGHGLCIRDAKSIGRAVKCLSDAVGSVVDQPGPTGDEDPDAVYDSVTKLEPKSGDVIVVKAETADQLMALREILSELTIKLDAQGVAVIFASSGVEVTIDNELAAKHASLGELDATIVRAQQEFDELEAATAARKSELAELTASTEKATADLTELQAKIQAAKQERLGRLSSSSVNDMLKERSESESTVQPEHYYASQNDQRDAMTRMLSGDAQPKTGRDMAL